MNNIKTTTSLVERLNQPLPYWVEEIEKEVYLRIAEAPFAVACRKGNKEVMRRLVINLWPFVDVFPDVVKRSYWKLIKPSFIFQYGAGNMVQLLRKSIRVLTSIERDEKEHRNLWIDIGTALGLDYPNDFTKNPTPQTKRWLESITDNKGPFNIFLGYVAIEIIAESISKNLLASETFSSILGIEGKRWFDVHAVHHGEKSHEALEFHLAFALHKAEPRKEEADKVIQYVVSEFLEAADASV